MKQTQSASNDDGFIEVAQNLTNTSYTYTNVTASGAKYEFRVKAQNSIGFGNYSDSLDIVAGTIPSAPDAPITTLLDDN